MANKTLNLSSAKASVIGLRISPRKAGEVASLVRGRSVADAITILSYTPRRAAQHIQKLVASAAANATNNHGISDKDLQITSLVVGPGVRYKRFRPVARGSAHPYMHRTSNIYITVSGEPKAIKKADAAKADAKPKEVTAKVKKESK
jgi:large subunit ribosomal protein L22